MLEVALVLLMADGMVSLSIRRLTPASMRGLGRRVHFWFEVFSRRYLYLDRLRGLRRKAVMCLLMWCLVG